MCRDHCAQVVRVGGTLAGAVPEVRDGAGDGALQGKVQNVRVLLRLLRQLTYATLVAQVLLPPYDVDPAYVTCLQVERWFRHPDTTGPHGDYEVCAEVQRVWERSPDAVQPVPR